MKKQIFLAASALALLAACSQNDDVSLTKETTPVSFTLNPTSTMTRTATTPSETATNGYVTQFADGDKVGIYQGTTTNCGEYTVNNNALTGNEIKINSGTTATFNAFSPYVESTGGSVQFSVKTDQSAKADFDASNFLTAQGSNTAGNYSVAFTFKPQLALMRVELTGQTGVTITEVKMNAVPSISWTVGTDAVSVGTGDKKPILFHAESTSANSVVYTAFVPAQSYVAGDQVLVMSVGSKSYEFKPKGTISLTAGAVNKINAQIGENITITTENISFDGLNVNDWAINEITVGSDEITEVPPIELITEAAGTFSSETTLNPAVNYQGCIEGWNALIANNEYGSVAFDETETAMKVVTRATGAWHQKALVYRTPINAGSLAKYKLTFQVKSENSKDIQVRVMRGQTTDVYTGNGYFCTGTNGFSGQSLGTTTDEYASKSVDVNFSRIKNNSETERPTTNDDLATGITVSFTTKTTSEAETFYIKNVKFIEVKE